MPATLTRCIAAAAVAAALPLASQAGMVELEFEGVIDINGFFPPDIGPPDFIDAVEGMPVLGTLTYDDALLPDSNDATVAQYTDPAGTFSLAFGAGGSLGVYESQQPLSLSVRNFPGSPDVTLFRVDGLIGNPITDPNFIAFSALFRFGSLNGTGPDLVLPGPFDTDDLLELNDNVGRGSITDQVGLTSYEITAVRAVPTPSTLAMGLAMLGLCTRRRRAA